MQIDRMKRGDRVVIRNGAKGEQFAVVASLTKNNTLRAHKWLMRGQRWTKAVTVYPVEVLRYASHEDARKRRVKPMSTHTPEPR